MQYYFSISEIKKTLPSQGSTPVVVECNNLKDYVCKYGEVNNLFNEYLAYSFARIWNIPTPPFCFVRIKPEHVPSYISRNNFNHTCFATEYLEHAMDINDYFTTWKEIPSIIRNILNKPDFLLIALFDLWLCNEDRHHANNNLMLNPVDAGYILTAIDHVNIFNSNSLFGGFNETNKLIELTENESIITSSYTNMLFRSKDLTKQIIDELFKKFYLCIENCSQSFNGILERIPEDWNIEASRYDLIASQIFADDWMQQTERHFRLILSDALKQDVKIIE